MVGYYNMIYREFKKGRVTIITKKSSSEMSYPEIFNVIAEDTIETLKSKKEKLDELLGL